MENNREINSTKQVKQLYDFRIIYVDGEEEVQDIKYKDIKTFNIHTALNLFHTLMNKNHYMVHNISIKYSKKDSEFLFDPFKKNLTAIRIIDENPKKRTDRNACKES